MQGKGVVVVNLWSAHVTQAVGAAAESRVPLVVTVAVLVGLFLLTQSVRLVGPDARVVVAREGRQRVAGPGLVLLWPVVDEARTITVSRVERRAVASGAVMRDGSRPLLVLRVRYRVTDPAVHASDESAWTTVELAVQRAVRRLCAAETAGGRISAEPGAWLSERVMAELDGLGVELERLVVEGLRLTASTNAGDVPPEAGPARSRQVFAGPR